MSGAARVLAVFLAIALGGCAGVGGKSDSISVRNIVAHAKAGSPYVVVTAVVDYDLVSRDEGRLILGLDTDTPGRIRLVAEKNITRGSGTAELSAEIQTRTEREILASMLSLEGKQRGPGNPPLAYVRGSLKYPHSKNETAPPGESASATNSAPNVSTPRSR